MRDNTVYLGDLEDGTYFITDYTKRKGLLVNKTISAAYVELEVPTLINFRNKDGYVEEKTILVRKKEPWSLKTVVQPLRRQPNKRRRKGRVKK